MRGKTKLENVMGKVQEMSLNYNDDTIPVADMEFRSLDMMSIGSNTFEVLPSAQRLLANRLRVPHSYLCRCPEELQAQNLNYWLEQQRKERETFTCP